MRRKKIVDSRGVATNSGLGREDGRGGRFKSGPFLYCKYERSKKESMEVEST